MPHPSSPDTQAGSGTSAGDLGPRRRRAILAVVALALMMVVSAVSGLNVALPDLQRQTGATATEVQWIVDAYTLVFAGMLLLLGALGDRFGRRPVLAAGILLFAGAAAVGLAVDDPGALIAVRAVMGLGAAAVMPVTLSVITTSFPPAERAHAIGVWVGVAGGGAVIGLFGSGILLEFFDWSSFFALNVTLGALALVGTLLVIPDSRDAEAPSLDAVGGVLSLLTVAGLVYGFIEGPSRGWTDGLTVAAFVVGVLAGVTFVVWELRRHDPLLDPRLFRRAGFGMGSLTITVQFFASFGFFFIILQYLQYVADLSPLLAACALAPLPVTLIPLARNAPRFALRFGANRVAGLGLALAAIGMLLMTRLSTDFVYWELAVAIVVFAAGMALATTPATMAITSSLPAGKQGVGSAVNDVSREFGSALGIAVLGSVLTDAYAANIEPVARQLPAQAADAVTSSLAAVEQLAPRFGEQGARVLEAARTAYVDATGSAFLVAAAVLAVAAVVVALKAPGAAELTAAVEGTPAAERAEVAP